MSMRVRVHGYVGVPATNGGRGRLAKPLRSHDGSYLARDRRGQDC